MAVYKVIQDIEAEDKLLGPLTLKQFIFAGIACGFLFAAFMVATRIKIYAAIPLIPFIVVPAVLAAPIGKDQPTDIWLAAQIRFLFKPRKRIWDQNDIKNLVTITAPKKVEKQYTDNLSQGEVRSRLKVLADTIDTRGWATKNAYSNPKTGLMDDRLINPYISPSQMDPEDTIANTADIMDPANNPLAQKFDQLAKQSESNVRSSAIKKMNTLANSKQDYDENADSNDYYFMRQPDTEQIDSGSAMFNQALIKVGNGAKNSYDGQNDDDISNKDEQELLEEIKSNKQKALQQNEMTTPHHKIIKTPAQLAKEEAEKLKNDIEQAKAQAVTPQENPDIVKQAQGQNLDDLSVATIAGLVNRKPKNTNIEGEIRLH